MQELSLTLAVAIRIPEPSVPDRTDKPKLVHMKILHLFEILASLF